MCFCQSDNSLKQDFSFIGVLVPQCTRRRLIFQEAAAAARFATTGDFALVASEVNLVISTLQEHNIQVTALHSHLLTEQLRLFFMHFWSVGDTQAVADGVKAALTHGAAK